MYPLLQIISRTVARLVEITVDKALKAYGQKARNLI
jgi:hypothetical protein